MLAKNMLDIYIWYGALVIELQPPMQLLQISIHFTMVQISLVTHLVATQ